MWMQLSQRRRIMNYKYQMTVQEFADLVANTVYECGYFQKGELAHPEDIEAAFTSTATAVAKGATFMIRKINNVAEKTDYTKKINTSIDSSGNVYSKNTI
jgi:hypothetical protein